MLNLEDRVDAFGLDRAARPRVALFQAFSRLHYCTMFSAEALVEAGYAVDIFLFDVDVSLLDDALNGIRGAHQIRVHSFNTHRTMFKDSGERRISPPLYRRVLNRIVNPVRRWMHSEGGFIPASILRSSSASVGDEKYLALIGIEKGGLVWAGRLGKDHGVPLIYWSLELYTRDHHSFRGDFNRRIKFAEERIHRRCSATIVQDERRGQVLLRENRVETTMPMLYVPVSRRGGTVRHPDTWLQRSLGLDGSTVLILYYGVIQEGRFSSALAETAQSFPSDWVLVFHGFQGWGSRTLASVRAIDKLQKCLLSTKLVEPIDEWRVMSSARVSLVLYNHGTVNDKLTGFASEKLALSLQCGVPVIAFDYETYEHIREEGCGVLISDVSEIPSAVRTILDDYESYRGRAFAAFDKHYSFDNSFAKVISTLGGLEKSAFAAQSDSA